MCLFTHFPRLGQALLTFVLEEFDRALQPWMSPKHLNRYSIMILFWTLCSSPKHESFRGDWYFCFTLFFREGEVLACSPTTYRSLSIKVYSRLQLGQYTFYLFIILYIHAMQFLSPLYLRTIQTNSPCPQIQVFVLVEEAEVPGENPGGHSFDKQTKLSAKGW